MSEYRIGVYAIALNEEKFVERWFESVKTADHILLADTGTAIKFGEMAQQLNSSDLRLQNNLKALKRSSEFSENRMR